jgi:hypothetical protein
MKKAVVASFDTLLQNLPVDTEEGHGKLNCLSQYSNQGPHRYKVNVRVFRTRAELLVVVVVLYIRTLGIN